MEQWLSDLLSLCPSGLNWEARRRWLILTRWPDASVRAAEQDYRMGDKSSLALYDAEVSAIKAAVPKL